MTRTRSMMMIHPFTLFRQFHRDSSTDAPKRDRVTSNRNDPPVVYSMIDQSTRLRTLIDGPSWIPLSTFLSFSHHRHHHDHHQDKQQRRKTFLMVSQIFEEGLFQYRPSPQLQGMIPCKDVTCIHQPPSATILEQRSKESTFKDSSFHSDAFVVVSGKSHIHNNPDERLEQNRENFTIDGPFHSTAA